MQSQPEVPTTEAVKTADNNSKQFITAWLFDRKPILKENIQAYDKTYSPGMPANDSDDRVDAVLNQQIKNMNKPPLEENNNLPTDIHGEYDAERRVIDVANDGLMNRTVTHERTHALSPAPQQVAIKNLFLKYPAYRQREEDPYLNTSGEVYARLMAFRKENNLKPNQVVTLDDLKKWRMELKDNQLEQYSNSFLLDLFNTIAYNDQPVDSKNTKPMGFTASLYSNAMQNKTT
jgi:hypothetical protein